MLYNNLEVNSLGGFKMFVSTYSTYLNTNSVNKTTKEKDTSIPSKPFSLNEALKSGLSDSSLIQDTPVNYLSYNKIISTKQRIYQQLEQNSAEKNIEKFTSINSKLHAPTTYTENTKMFSLMLKEQQTLKSKEPINKDLPKEIQELKESNLRATMVNTYIANDKYYRVTA